MACGTCRWQMWFMPQDNSAAPGRESTLLSFGKGQTVLAFLPLVGACVALRTHRSVYPLAGTVRAFTACAAVGKEIS
jgi:hypothetical protein